MQKGRPGTLLFGVCTPSLDPLGCLQDQVTATWCRCCCKHHRTWAPYGNFWEGVGPNIRPTVQKFFFIPDHCRQSLFCSLESSNMEGNHGVPCLHSPPQSRFKLLLPPVSKPSTMAWRIHLLKTPIVLPCFFFLKSGLPILLTECNNWGHFLPPGHSPPSQC